MDILYEIITCVIIFLPAILAAALFVFALIRFRKAELPEERRKRKTLFIVSSVILGTVAAAYAGILILLSLAIRNM